MTVAFQRMFGILEPWNNNQVTTSLSKPHELSYRSNNIIKYLYIYLLRYKIKLLAYVALFFHSKNNMDDFRIKSASKCGT